MSEKPLRVLIVEDSEDDALLLVRDLKRGGYEPSCERVETEEAMRKALKDQTWDIVLSDFRLPRFDGMKALAVYNESGLNIPFILVSGMIGEDAAVDAMKAGAHDYVNKRNTARLIPAVDRELRETLLRREKLRLEEDTRKAAQEWHTTFDAMKDAVFLLDSRNVIKRCNKAFSDLVGKPFREILGHHCWSIVHNTDGPVEDCPCQIMMRSMKHEAVVLSMYGRIHEASVNPILGEDGKIEGIVHVLADITERMKAEESIREKVILLRKATEGIINVVSMAVETRDPYTAGHQRRVASLARSIGVEMGLPAQKVEGIYMAGLIHDLGKISIPAEILSTPRKLTALEYSFIQTHSAKGFEILKDIEFPWPIAQTVLQHHERLDGSGYPGGLKGDEILQEAKIMAVADVVEAMASHRPYRAALGTEAALEEIEKNRGVLYDPEATDVCLSLMREKGFLFQ